MSTYPYTKKEISLTLTAIHNAVEELNSGLPRTNPDSSKVNDLNQRPPDFKSSALNHSGTLPPSVNKIFTIG